MNQMHSEKEARREVEGDANQGDNRTPDKPIGQVKYADNEAGEQNKSETPKTKATDNVGLQDDHDPSDIGQKGVNNAKAEKSQMEGPAAYAPHEEGERAFPDRNPTEKRESFNAFVSH